MKRVLFICSFLLTVPILWGQVRDKQASDSVSLKPYATHNDKIQNGEILFRVKELQKKMLRKRNTWYIFKKLNRQVKPRK